MYSFPALQNLNFCAFIEGNMASAVLCIPLHGDGTSTVPLMAFLGEIPRHVKQMELDIGLKVNQPSRIVVALTARANEKIQELLVQQESDILLRFQPCDVWSDGTWIGSVIPSGQYLEVKLPVYENCDLCDSFVYIVTNDAAKTGTLRLTISDVALAQKDEPRVGRPPVHAAKRGRKA